MGGRALAYLEHCDENGDVTWESMASDSFAHLFSDGRIKRYQQVIGNEKDLIPVGE